MFPYVITLLFYFTCFLQYVDCGVVNDQSGHGVLVIKKLINCGTMSCHGITNDTTCV